MKTRFKRLHIETRDGDGSIELDISGEREISQGVRFKRSRELERLVEANSQDLHKMQWR